MEVLPHAVELHVSRNKMIINRNKRIANKQSFKCDHCKTMDDRYVIFFTSVYKYYLCKLQFFSMVDKMHVIIKLYHHFYQDLVSINNGNWTEWSAIWAEIIRMISKSNKYTVQVWFEITSMISDQNCTTQSSITTLLHPFWNRPNTGFGQFKYVINVVLSWFEIKSSIFWG